MEIDKKKKQSVSVTRCKLSHELSMKGQMVGLKLVEAMYTLAKKHISRQIKSQMEVYILPVKVVGIVQ